jgi:hypothetical protein
MRKSIIHNIQQAYKNHKLAATGNVIISLLVLFNLLWIGFVYGGGASRQLLDVLVTPVNTVSLAAVSISATTLGLMLTLLSLMYQSERRFDENFYHSIMDIGAMCVVALIGTVVILSINSIPVEETKNVEDIWFDIIYYVLIALVAYVSGVMVNIILMLFETVKGLVDTMRFTDPESQNETDQEQKAVPAQKKKSDEPSSQHP